MLARAATVLQRVLTLTWSAPSVCKFNIVFCSALALAVAVRLVVAYSSLLEIAFATMIQAACFLTVYRVQQADDDRFRAQGCFQPGSELVRMMNFPCGARILLRQRASLATFITGYILWWIDILLCNELGSWRQRSVFLGHLCFSRMAGKFAGLVRSIF